MRSVVLFMLLAVGCGPHVDVRPTDTTPRDATDTMPPTTAATPPTVSAPAEAPAEAAPPEVAPAGNAAPPEAARVPEPFHFKHVNHVNMHSSGELGVSSDQWVVSEVALVAAGGAKVEVVDEGERGDSSATSEGAYNVEKTHWRNRWTGTKSADARGFVLRLALVESSCEKTALVRISTESGIHESTDKKACPRRAKRLVLACEATKLEIEPDLYGAAAAQERDAWLCLPRARGETPEGTPSPWFFSAEDCIETSPGYRGGFSHRRCSAGDGEL
jgi:hypothetical protein